MSMRSRALACIALEAEQHEDAVAAQVSQRRRYRKAEQGRQRCAAHGSEQDADHGPAKPGGLLTTSTASEDSVTPSRVDPSIEKRTTRFTTNAGADAKQLAVSVEFTRTVRA